jgi:hypothetical protein
MKSFIESIRRFFIGKGKTKVGFVLFLVLGLLVLSWPADTIMCAYTGNDGTSVGAPFAGICLIILAIGGVYALGIVHIIVWVWGIFAIVQHGVESYRAIIYFILMLISILWISALWLSDDLSESLFKKGE